MQLQAGAGFIGWEIICLGRPAANELFVQGRARQAFEIWRDHQPLLLERANLVGGDEVLSAQWGLQNYPVTGTMMAVNADDAMLQSIRDNPPVLDGLFSATLIDDVLVCRVLSHQGENARHALLHVWQILRPLLLHRQACVPRIWST